MTKYDYHRINDILNHPERTVILYICIVLGNTRNVYYVKPSQNFETYKQ